MIKIVCYEVASFMMPNPFGMRFRRSKDQLFDPSTEKVHDDRDMSFGSSAVLFVLNVIRGKTRVWEAKLSLSVSVV